MEENFKECILDPGLVCDGCEACDVESNMTCIHDMTHSCTYCGYCSEV